MVQSEKSIMVVDDDPSVRRVVARALVGKGHRVCTASNGVDALMAADDEHFDLMFLDIRMPGMSGLDVLSEMTKRHPSTAVVMLTAVTGTAVQEEASRREAFAYLTKPCELHKVKKIANKMLFCGV